MCGGRVEIFDRPPAHLAHGGCLKGSHTEERRLIAFDHRCEEDVGAFDVAAFVVKTPYCFVDWPLNLRNEAQLLHEFARGSLVVRFTLLDGASGRRPEDVARDVIPDEEHAPSAIAEDDARGTARDGLSFRWIVWPFHSHPMLSDRRHSMGCDFAR